jgi:uncharacterized hydrophobic protein (TIGR00271 family)
MAVFDWLKKRVKTTPESRYAYAELKDAARPDRGYLVMIAVSAFIATFGLFLDSVAVIIGAMLIAPLMSPVLATGLAVARGDPRFLRQSLAATAQGAVLAVLCAAAVAVVSPELALGHEIVSRTRPTLFDLAVAFASGVAGAYTFSDKDLSPMLPGVAIAAALIPPLSVAGIGLGFGSHEIMWGAILLFAANLIAISFGAAVTFVALGFFPKVKGGEGEWRIRALIAAGVLLAFVTVPMAYFTVTNVRSASREKNVSGTVERYLPAREGFNVGPVTWARTDGVYDVTILVYGGEEPSRERLALVKGELGERLGGPVKLRVRYVSYAELTPD